MNTIKPKKAGIYVPGFGVVTRENFTDEHLKVLLDRAKKNNLNIEAFAKQYFDVIVDFSEVLPADEDEKLKAESDRKIKEAEEAEEKSKSKKK